MRVQCVDSHGDEKQNGLYSLAGALGGDFAELAVSIVSFHRWRNSSVTRESVEAMFKSFMAKIASPMRPFYLHSSDAKMVKVFSDVSRLIKELQRWKLPNPGDLCPVLGYGPQEK